MKKPGLLSHFIALSCLLVALPCAAQMDIHTNTLVIKKLNRVLSELSTTNPTRYAIMDRLADLYSERARQEAMGEIQKSGHSGAASHADRLTALRYYHSAFDHLTEARKETDLLQMAQLYKLLNQGKKAEKLLLGVIHKGTYSGRLVGKAETEIANIKFNNGHFRQAAQFYRQALVQKETPQKGFIVYRLAWCLLNSGQQKQAVATLTHLLKSPALLADSATSSAHIDHSFHQDVARDLALFLARAPITQSAIDELVALSPRKDIKANLHLLAEEASRLGQKRPALRVWRQFLKYQPTAFDRLDAKVSMTKIQYDLGHKRQAALNLKKVLNLWQKEGCSDKTNCEFLKQKLRQFLIAWDHEETKKPTQNLLDAFSAYNHVFIHDTETHKWAGDIARRLSQWSTAIHFYDQASILARGDLQNKPENKKYLQKLFESSLLGEIAVAETSKNPSWRLNAYNHYLALNPEGPEVLTVLYQKAHTYYETNRYQQAAEIFGTVAQSTRQDQKGLKVKAANLALDSLALNKNETQLQQWAQTYARLFRRQRLQYSGVYRKSVLREASTIIDAKTSSSASYLNALKKLDSVSLSGATKDEKVSYYKDRILLDERVHDIADIERSAQALYSLHHITDQDDVFALKRLVWAAEMRMNFAKAYRLARKMKFQSESERQLQLGQLAELAGKNPRVHYQKFIKLTHNRRQANEIRLKLITLSSRPWRELFKNLSALKSSPDLLAMAGLESYARRSNTSYAKRLLSQRRVQRTSSGHALYRYVFLHDFEQSARQMSHHPVRTSSAYLLKKTLKRRLRDMDQLNTYAKKAAQSGDWTLQVVTLRALQKQNLKLYQKLMALHPDARLKPQARRRYQLAMARQAKPLLKTALQAQAKLKQLWNHQDDLNSVIQDYQTASFPIKNLLVNEISQLSAVAPPDQEHLLRQTVRSGNSPSHQQIILARQKLQHDPFDRDKVLQLKNLEALAGGQAMVTYLQDRLHQMEARP